MESTTISELVAQKTYQGLAHLMRLHAQNIDLVKLGQALLESAIEDTSNVQAIMDAAIVVQFLGDQALALQLQQEALLVRRRYTIPARISPVALRVLALMAPGELMANVPIECLLEHSDITLECYYAAADDIDLKEIPDHDVLFFAMSESEANRPIMRAWAPILAHWPVPIINRPSAIPNVARDTASALLQPLSGVVMPPTYRVDRHVIESVLHGGKDNPLALPLIIRPIDSHAGHDLVRVDNLTILADELAKVSADTFFVSPFVDYSDADGQFRKYRVVLIDGVPYPAHMAISTHWMIHYMNAGMMESQAKRDEEAKWFETFDQEFAPKHRQALQAIYEVVGLDYLGIDCAQTQDGRLLVFEIDHAMVVHDMDPPDVFPYKHEPMQRIFDAFRRLLITRAKG